LHAESSATLNAPNLSVAQCRNKGLSPRVTLQREHEFFYHFTLDSYLESIRNNGIEPNYEGIDSAYSQRRLEPARAMRFCTKEELSLGYRTALTRNSVFDDSQGIWTQGNETVVLLRVKSRTLLSREFRLDYFLRHGK
jgi:hypothetical protein